MYSENTSLEDLERALPRRHRHSSLSIHPYFGKVDPTLASKAIELYSSEGDVVLDPFCGSGTVLHDALLQGRSAIGWDSSALAAMISAAKVLGINDDEELELRSLVGNIRIDVVGDLLQPPQEVPVHPVPAMPRVRSVSDWFAPNALRELAYLRAMLTQARIYLSPVAAHLATVAFSRIITASSNQQGESTYRKIDKPDHPGRVLKLFEKAVNLVIASAKAFNLEAIDKIPQFRRDRLEIIGQNYRVTHGDLKVEISVRDSRDKATHQIPAPSPSLVVTSPPYLMSWDYGLYHKFRFYWLDLDLDAYEETEIGRHLRRRKDDVERYTSDMTEIFKTLYLTTSANADVFMVNAASIVYGKEVDTNTILISCAETADWVNTWGGPTIDIPGPHHGMYGSLEARNATAPSAAGKKEYVLLFKKQDSFLP